LLPIFAKDILGVGPQGLGILYAASAFGSLAGAFVLSFTGRVKRVGRWILAGVMVYGLAIILFGVSQLFWFSAFLLAVSGIGDTISAIMRSTINQLETPEELRGRMSSINSLFTNCGPQLGQFQAGALASVIGAELAVMSGGFVIFLIVAVLVFRFPHVRDFKIGSPSP
jgi:MFS family permease